MLALQNYKCSSYSTVDVKCVSIFFKFILKLSVFGLLTQYEPILEIKHLRVVFSILQDGIVTFLFV